MFLLGQPEAQADRPVPRFGVAPPAMLAPAVPHLRLALALRARGGDVALHRERMERVPRVRVAVAFEAQELQPVQRLMPNDVGIPDVGDVVPAAHPAPLTRPARARDHAAPLRLPCVPIFASCHG